MASQARRLLFVVIAPLTLLSSTAAQKPAPPGVVPRAGSYACVFAFGGQFFDTKPITIKEGKKYETVNGDGTFRYEAASRRIRFETGILARDYPSAQYVGSGPVRGGLKNKTGPAVVLQPSPAFKKRQGEEAVPQYCYLQKEPAR